MGATSIGDVEPQADVMDASEAHGDASNQAEACEEAGFRFFFVMLYRERSAYKLRCAVGVLVLRVMVKDSAWGQRQLEMLSHRLTSWMPRKLMEMPRTRLKHVRRPVSGFSL